MTRIAQQSKPLSLVKPSTTPVKPAAVIDVAGVARKLFNKDELAKAAQKVKPSIIGIDPAPLFAKHNQRVALHLKDTVTKLQSQAANLEPMTGLNAALNAPRKGKDGRWTAPNGDPLIRVPIAQTTLNRSVERNEYALVNPKTNEVFYVTDDTHFMHGTSTTIRGPVDLPRSQRFIGSDFTPAQVRNFERTALLGAALDSFKKKPLAERVEQMLANGTLRFDQPAPKPENVKSEKLIKSEHPFSYYAVVLKDQPGKVVIKKVLTGGFVPAQPGDGTYSQAIPV
ncbi:MAG: hypothetical protein ACO1OB_22780 [Archangium sp.]